MCFKLQLVAVQSELLHLTNSSPISDSISGVHHRTAASLHAALKDRMSGLFAVFTVFAQHVGGRGVAFASCGAQSGLLKVSQQGVTANNAQLACWKQAHQEVCSTKLPHTHPWTCLASVYWIRSKSSVTYDTSSKHITHRECDCLPCFCVTSGLLCDKRAAV